MFEHLRPFPRVIAGQSRAAIVTCRYRHASMKAVLIFMYFAMPSGVAADPSPEPGTAAYVYAETVGANDIKVPVYSHPPNHGR